MPLDNNDASEWPCFRRNLDAEFVSSFILVFSVKFKYIRIQRSAWLISQSLFRVLMDNYYYAPPRPAPPPYCGGIMQWWPMSVCPSLSGGPLPYNATVSMAAWSRSVSGIVTVMQCLNFSKQTTVVDWFQMFVCIIIIVNISWILFTLRFTDVGRSVCRRSRCVARPSGNIWTRICTCFSQSKTPKTERPSKWNTLLNKSRNCLYLQ